MDIAIITGASAGLGQAFFRSVVRRYSKLDQIWLIARRADRLQQLAQDNGVRYIQVIFDDGYVLL